MSKLLIKSLLLLILISFTDNLFAQSNITFVNGIVKSETGEILSGVNIRLKSTQNITQTDKNGFYSLRVLSQHVTLIYSRVGYKSLTLELGLLKGQTNKQDVTLIAELRTLDEVKIKGTENKTNSTFINPVKLQSLPSVTGNFESILKTLPGVSTNNELSSQYSVRGGNFDENLVYVNDVEIYRPLLVRNGQQEGLSFINSELAGQVKFSAGGFEARYGDKLSSVLDVKYAKPDTFSLAASAGLLGTSLTIKAPFKNSYILTGIRYKKNQNILNTQEVAGNYQPDFSDYQILYNKDLNHKLSFSIFGDYNLSKFNLIPKSRETIFGTSDEVLRLQVEYEGKEADRYETSMGAFTMVYKPSSTLNFKWINSAFHITEKEDFDIDGQYIFDELETSLGDLNFGKVRASRGIGSNLDYARNKLQSIIYSTEFRVYKQFSKSYFESGVRLQRDQVKDNLNEFTVIDSAGYTLPNNFGPLLLTDVVNAQNTVNTNRISGFLQNTFNLSFDFTLAVGIRGYYNSYTHETLISPRISLAYQPKTINDLLLRLSTGIYDQQPSYRELRNFDGSLNTNIKSQRSVHFLTGADYSFRGFGTNVKFTSELYYKLLNRLTPYTIENLRIRYFADQQSKGYAAGADFSLSGEFVKDLESSFRLSFMKSEEDIKGDYDPIKKMEPGYLKRPTDQLVNFSIFFQDRLLKIPTYKVHLNLLYGTALPTGPPQAQRYQDVFKIPAYRRVDIGFSKDFVDPESKHIPIFLKKYFQSLIAYAEIFNLLDINNTVSYLWIKDVTNHQYAIPNFLTSRQLNVKIIASLRYK